jgi:proteasome lid subunit RPN8/RPN11
MPLITPAALAAIQAHAQAAFPEECCGLLLGSSLALDSCILEAVPAQNLATSNRATRYFLDPLGYLHADRLARAQKMEVIGFYHSHPDHPATPSPADDQLAWDAYFYLILPVSAQGFGTARLWRFASHIPEELTLATVSGG